MTLAVERDVKTPTLTFDLWPLWLSLVWTVTYTRDVIDDKYCLEINTTQKSEKIKLAKKAKKNKQFLEQNKPLFAFTPIYRLTS